MPLSEQLHGHIGLYVIFVGKCFIRNVIHWSVRDKSDIAYV